MLEGNTGRDCWLWGRVFALRINKGSDIMKLYTCKSGLQLFKRGRSFGAWTKDAKSFKEADNNIEISVDVEDIMEIENEYGAYHVTDVKSVVVIGQEAG